MSKKTEMTNELTTDRVAALLAEATDGRRVRFHSEYCPEAQGTPFTSWDSSHETSVILTDGTRYSKYAVHRHANDAALDALAYPLAEAYIAQAARVEALEQALNLAANRLHRCSVDYDTGSLRFYETGEWADEARAVIKRAGQ